MNSFSKFLLLRNIMEQTLLTNPSGPCGESPCYNYFEKKFFTMPNIHFDLEVIIIKGYIYEIYLCRTRRSSSECSSS